MNPEALSPLLPKDLDRYPEYAGHELVVPVIHEGRVHGFISIHRFGKESGIGSGGTRFWNFGSEEEALRDALRLSQAMTYKHALGGSPFGGAKGVLFSSEGSASPELLRSYAETINALNGKFTTGMDVGFSQHEIDILKSLTPHLVGLDRDLSEFTGIGLWNALESCLFEVFGDTSLANRIFLLQGAGKVSTHFLRALKENAERQSALPQIFFSEINPERAEWVRSFLPHAVLVSPEEIYDITADAFIPCALGGTINIDTASRLNVKIVCGAANNQLADEEAGKILYERQILYAPDYIANGGGMIAVVDGHEHKNFDRPRLIERLKHIPKILTEIFSRSKLEKERPEVIADKMAENIFSPL